MSNVTPSTSTAAAKTTQSHAAGKNTTQQKDRSLVGIPEVTFLDEADGRLREV